MIVFCIGGGIFFTFNIPPAVPSFIFSGVSFVVYSISKNT